VNDSNTGREPNSVPRLLARAQARDALRLAARTSVIKERGGILVGFRDGTDITVEDIIEVPDATARRTTYVRREHPAREALNDYLKRTGSNDPVGYVGEWHTHPAQVPLSRTDQHAMRTMARKNRKPVALVVAALGTDKHSVNLHALISRPDTLRSRVAGHHSAAVVTVE